MYKKENRTRKRGSTENPWKFYISEISASASPKPFAYAPL